MSSDYLKIEGEKEDLQVWVNFGYIDRVSGAFDFKKNETKNITGYKLALDLENTDSKTLYELEKLIHSDNKIINAIVSLDGIIAKGKAKIAQIFSFEGVSYDIEIIN